jgi:hypothetical protein
VWRCGPRESPRDASNRWKARQKRAGGGGRGPAATAHAAAALGPWLFHTAPPRLVPWRQPPPGRAGGNHHVFVPLLRHCGAYQEGCQVLWKNCAIASLSDKYVSILAGASGLGMRALGKPGCNRLTKTLGCRSIKYPLETSQSGSNRSANSCSGCPLGDGDLAFPPFAKTPRALVMETHKNKDFSPLVLYYKSYIGQAGSLVRYAW